MYSGKKLTKEDTWKPSDLSRYLKEGNGDERRHRGGESTERRRRETEKESRKERDKQRESTRERRDEDERHTERRKEESRDRRGERERRGEKGKREQEGFPEGDSYDSRERRDRRSDREKRDERDRRERDSVVEVDKHRFHSKERRDRKQEHERAKEKERHRDKERERDATKEEKDKERRRHHRTESERRRHEESGEGDFKKHERDRRERHRDRERHADEYKERKNERERRERLSEGKEEKGHREDHRRHREEKERRQKERDHQDEKRRRDRDRGREGASDEVRRHRGDGERSERDRRREMRLRERGEEEGRSHGSSSDKTAPEKSRRQASGAAVLLSQEAAKTSDHGSRAAEAVGDTGEPGDADAQEYEEDFEEYEEDFEEMDESEHEGGGEEEPRRPDVREEEEEEAGAQWKKEMEAIQRAMDEENKRVTSAQSRRMSEEDVREHSRASEKTPPPPSGRFIDFMAAKQREVSQKITEKQKKRSTELLRLIDLDFSVTFSVLDLPPVNEYDMYIRSFGTANTRQAYVQCNEDNVDRDIQTEEIDVSQKWTQHPPEHAGACGDPNLPWEALTFSQIDVDSRRLTSFLRSASQVMAVLLEEEQAERESPRKHGSPADTMSFSDGSSRLNTKIPFLSGRSISQLQVQRNTLMSVHVPAAGLSHTLLDDCTLICIWNIWEPSRPQKVLTYQSEVQCCCFSPGKASLVFAGTSVGSVVLWDLREYASDHHRVTIEEEEWTLRQPTFSTDAVMARWGHFSSVVSVEAVSSAAAGELRSEVPLLASVEESSGLSFQLASLDETGVLNFWVVLELPKANEAGSPTDLGLRPGGRVKLLHSSAVLTAERSRRDAATTGLQTLRLKFLPTDSNHFFTGTNMGLVNHGTSHGLKATPKFYRCQDAGVRPVDVTEIHFSPFQQHLFLVGCGDGSVRLHAVRQEHPVAEWSSGDPVVSVQWSPTRPAVFCVLDAASNLHIWDLLESSTQPVITEKLLSDRVTAMTLFGDPGQQNPYSGVALAHQSGTIELQYFTAGLTTPSPAEVEKLERMADEAL
ncbi:WD repeat-containing protein 60 [Takifugu rubripes]|uniref:WD repeat-containing protein 60 n=1 Tax=Takifugu rubripes TaxID=31033 RepID=UPI0011456BC8|nr:WD repeat-containing protein 60 [Takifugu rubripes]